MPDRTYEQIGRRLSQARQHVGFTQQQVSEFLGISREQVSYVETGRRPIDLPMLQRLADLYGFSLTYLLASDNAQAPARPAVAAFRADSIEPDDLEVIRWVKRFAMNLDSLGKILTAGRESST